MSTQSQTFMARMVAPVPVGHRVEITWFERPNMQLFGLGAPRVMDDDEPLIRDLDSGVLYTVHWHHSGTTAAAHHDSYPEPLHPSLRPVARVVGRVVACRLVSVGLLGTNWGPQTYLTVEAEGQ